MKKLSAMFLAAFASVAFAQQSVTTTVIKNVTTTVVESVEFQQKVNGIKKIAVFVQNRTSVKGMDDEVDGVRDRLSSALAEVDGFSVMDSAQVVDTFRRYKVTTAEEKAGVLAGIFTGGSVPRVTQMLGCDYIAAATIVNASCMNRNIGGRACKVFTLRMTLKIMDSTGASVDGMPTWVRQYPVVDAADDPMNFYQILFDKWALDVTSAIAQKAPKWRNPKSEKVPLVAFHVSTTIDETIAELESQTKGANGESLQELRKVVGGATIELDGAVIGSAPGDFRAASGQHQLRVTREWMKPYAATVNIYEGMSLKVALEMSDEGLAKWGSTEALRADVARRYAEAVRERGMKINIDTSNWRDVGTSGIRVINE
jgi:alpha-acetolactate decarboxylase